MRAAPVVVIAALCLAAPSLARAQQPATPGLQEERSAARALAQQGFELFEAKKFEEAFSHFAQAEERFHAPPHLLYMARAHEKMGKLTSARDLYALVVGEKLTNYAPDEFRQAQAEAVGELESVKRRIPTLRVTVTGVSAEAARITVDGAAPPVGWQTGIPLDPGEHVVEGSATNASARRSVTLKESAREAVELDLTPGATAPAAVTAPAAQEGGRPRLIVPAIAAFGLGAVGLGVGAVTGFMSLGKVPECPNDACRPDQKPDADSAKTLGTVSTITFIVGGIGVAAGAILLVLDGGAPKAEATATRAPSVRPRVGLGSIGLDGTF